MASSLKQITSNDVKTVKTQLHEVIPITGSIVSGTYYHDGGTGNEKNDTVLNVKKYTHGMFQSVYDYPYLSSSANHIFDLTVGVRSDTGFYKSGSSTLVGGGPTQIATASVAQATEKYNIYSQMAQILVGHDQTGAIKPFGLDGKNNTDEYVDAAVFIPFSRLLVKDEIEKGSFELKFGTSSLNYQTPFSRDISGVQAPVPMVISDVGAATNFYNNSPAGEYAVLYSGSVATASAAVGLLYYQAGVAVINLSRSSDITTADRTSLIVDWTGDTTHQLSSTRTMQFVSHSGASAFNERPAYDTYWSTTGSIRSASIDEVCDGFRHRLQSVSFRNTTELNSTIYFCRANHNEFNYSSNPTYLSASQIVVKNNNAKNDPRTYVTTVGLHSPDGVMLASAKLSEPLQKSPQTDFTIRVRLDY